MEKNIINLEKIAVLENLTIYTIVKNTIIHQRISQINHFHARKEPLAVLFHINRQINAYAMNGEKITAEEIEEYLPGIVERLKND
jgi:hypothetical protein